MTKYSAFGTALFRAGFEIAQVSNISGPGLSLDTVDVTTHDQETPWEQVVATILRTGEVSLDLVFDPAEHADLLTELEGKEVDETYELRFPDAALTMWEFTAFVTGFEPSAPVDGKLSATATFKITGQPTLDSNYSI